MRPSDANPRIVITGGPGAGKSTLIGALAARGFRTEPEAGRAIIKRELESGGRALPWLDPLAFAEAMADSDRTAHARHEGAEEPTFFDRGLPDVLGYLQLSGLPAPLHLTLDAGRLRYRDPVFLAPFWPDIYVQDDERLQSPGEALRTGLLMARVYADLGYDLIELPLTSVANRITFILDRIL